MDTLSCKSEDEALDARKKSLEELLRSFLSSPRIVEFVLESDPQVQAVRNATEAAIQVLIDPDSLGR